MSDDPKQNPPQYPYDGQQPHQPNPYGHPFQEPMLNPGHVTSSSTPVSGYQAPYAQLSSNSPQQTPYPHSDPSSTPPVTIITLPPGQTLESICNNSGNEQLYPISGRLYNTMCSELGGNNVKPIPDYLKSEKLRKKWLKRGENALLYFLHRKDHYRAELQKMSDISMCNFCCVKIKGDNQVSGCLICCNECFSCCCCMWPFIGDIRAKLYANVGNIAQLSTGTCCPFCCGGVSLLETVGSRFSKMGVTGMEHSGCGACCLLFFCQPCIATKTQLMVRYLYFKRYGSMTTYQGLLDEAVESPEYQEYLKTTKDSPHHPFGRAQTFTIGRYGTQTSILTDREWPLQLGTVINDMGHEFYHLRGAIAVHNKYWTGLHRVQME